MCQHGGAAAAARCPPTGEPKACAHPPAARPPPPAVPPPSQQVMQPSRRGARRHARRHSQPRARNNIHQHQTPGTHTRWCRAATCMHAGAPTSAMNVQHPLKLTQLYKHHQRQGLPCLALPQALRPKPRGCVAGPPTPSAGHPGTRHMVITPVRACGRGCALGGGHRSRPWRLARRCAVMTG